MFYSFNLQLVFSVLCIKMLHNYMKKKERISPQLLTFRFNILKSEFSQKLTHYLKSIPNFWILGRSPSDRIA